MDPIKIAPPPVWFRVARPLRGLGFRTLPMELLYDDSPLLRLGNTPRNLNVEFVSLLHYLPALACAWSV